MPLDAEQLGGYMVAMFGVLTFCLVRQQPDRFEDSFLAGLAITVKSIASKASRQKPARRRNPGDLDDERTKTMQEATQAEMDTELDENLGIELQKVAARALNIDIEAEAAPAKDAAQGVNATVIGSTTKETSSDRTDEESGRLPEGGEGFFPIEGSEGEDDESTFA
mmetsp:Transcript_12102/g.26870  ORF Transcript_12102/g.26870 Transcript_12102/m.26870 type:complete len:166 (+) Transcript_12102:273-770(+)